MRVGLIAPPWLPVPPPAYGGTEVVVDNLARGLQALGHEVVLFTIGQSTCPVPRQYLYQSAVEPMGAGVKEAAHVLAAYEALCDVDVIHDHSVLGPLLAGRRGLRRPPVVVTNHGPFDFEARRIFREIAGTAAIVAISHAQAGTAGRIPIAAVIHHGVDLEVYRYGSGDGGYLLFVGRMSRDKGVHHAVRIAKRSGKRLVIVTKMREAAELAYYRRCVRPLLGPGDEVPRERPLSERLELLRGATALLNPISWPEPFGLVMVEALASGTPVLAFPNGAAPEIVEHSLTGYLCADEDAMTAAIERAPGLDRRRCRTAAEQLFSLDRMAFDHAGLYWRVLNGRYPLADAGPAAPGAPRRGQLAAGASA
jgi:glycosyltransferase involved in cell wall biosynthesis